MEERPLISFVVLAFNQERYVADAVKGALWQSYSPLQVILSDDASPDATFDIMTRLANDYRGPHSIKLNRNAKQRGLGAHLDAVVELAKGELIVISAGDDVSLPRRTETIVRVWERHRRQPTSLYSDYTSIDQSFVAQEAQLRTESSTSLPECVQQKVALADFADSIQPNVYGCTHAFSPKLYRTFGPLSEEVTYEDMALSFRSHAVGSLLHIKAPLVLYRRHDSNVSFHSVEQRASNAAAYRALEQKRRRMLVGFIKGYNRFEADARTLLKSGALAREQFADTLAAIERGRQNLQSNLALVDGVFPQRLKAFLSLYRNGVRGRNLAAAALRCLPSPVYRTVRITSNRLAA